MDREIAVKLRSSFEAMVQKHVETGTEFWCARDLQLLLGYARWENFAKVIDRAVTSCKNAGYEPRDHFLGVTKMVDLGSGAKREIDDIALTRYACYLIAQNGDPSKDPVAFAQTYFAVQTRKQEIIERRLAEAERVSARKKLTRSERDLSGIIFDRLRERLKKNPKIPLAENINITDNAIIPLKERVMDDAFDPIVKLIGLIKGTVAGP